MADEFEFRVELISGRQFIVDTKLSQRNSRELFAKVDEIVGSSGATETHGDGSWTRHPPSQIRSVTCQPKGVGLTKGGIENLTDAELLERGRELAMGILDNWRALGHTEPEAAQIVLRVADAAGIELTEDERSALSAESEG